MYGALQAKIIIKILAEFLTWMEINIRSLVLQNCQSFQVLTYSAMEKNLIYAEVKTNDGIKRIGARVTSQDQPGA